MNCLFPNFYYFALAFAGLVLLFSLLARENRVARYLRISSLFLLLSCLFEPILQFPFAAKPWFLVLIDTSGSMRVGQRLEEAHEALSRVRTKKKVYGFSNHPYPLGTDEPWATSVGTKGELTSIGNALLETPSPSAYLLLSDGVNNSGPDPISVAENEDIPIYTVKIGDSMVGDVRISGITHKKVVYVGDEVSIRARFENSKYDEHKIEILLKEDNRLLEKREVVLTDRNGENETEFYVTVETPGSHSYEVSISGVPDDVNVENNRRKFGITVLKSRIRVGWFSNKPGWNLKFARLEVAEDTRIQLEWWVRAGDGKWMSKNGIVSVPDFNAPYDVVVLEDFDCRGESPRIGEKTGVIIIGKSCEELSPLTLGALTESANCSVHVTADFGIFKRRILPPLQETYLVKGTKSGSKILCTTHAGAPLMVKKGTIIGIAASDIWRWSFAPELRFWNEMIRTVALQGPALLLQTDPVVEAGERITFEADAYTSGYAPDPGRSIVVEVTRTDGAEQPPHQIPLYSLGNGKYKGAIGFLSPGKYQYEAVTGGGYSVKDSFLVVSQIELQNLRPNEGFLRRLSSISGGKYIEDIEELKTALIQTRSAMPFHPSRSFLCLFLIVFLLSMEWFWLRK
jgi:hypothetical protein